MRSARRGLPTEGSHASLIHGRSPRRALHLIRRQQIDRELNDVLNQLRSAESRGESLEKIHARISHLHQEKRELGAASIPERNLHEWRGRSPLPRCNSAPAGVYFFIPMPSNRSRKSLRPQANILVVRTDRLGDVILTLPLVSVLRDHLPHARLTMLLRRYTGEIVQGKSGSGRDSLVRRSTADQAAFFRMAGILRRKSSTPSSLRALNSGSPC